MALRCDHPGAPWLSQPGPPAPDTALLSSGRARGSDGAIDVARDKEDRGKERFGEERE